MLSRAFPDIVELESFFPFLGFTIGDCLIPRVFRGFGRDLLLDFRGRMLELAGAEWESKFVSIGELLFPEAR
jgi:hypothetical protein